MGCQELYQECSAAASGIVQRGQCVVQLGLCLAAKLVTCSKDCIAPMLLCKAKALGSFQKLLQCNIAFVKCAIGGCTNATAEDDYSPYETAITLLEEKYGIADECKTMHQACMGAATTIRERVKCFIQLGVCVGAKVVGCSKTCIMPLIQCKLSAGHDWPAVFQCCKDFIQCAIGGCKGGGPVAALEFSPDEVAVEMYFPKSAELGIADECRDMHRQCISLARNPIQRIKCLAQLGLCLGARIVGCSKDCIAPLIQCKIGAIGSWIGTFKCCADFIKCAIGGCSGGGGPPPRPPGELLVGDQDFSPYEMAIATLYEDPSYTLTEHFKQCKATNDECVGNAGGNMKEKVKCFLAFGFCIGKEVVGCAAHCLPPLVMCEIGAKGSWVKTFMCASQFAMCAKRGCIDPKATLDTVPLISNNGTEKGVPKACKDANEECLKGGKGIMHQLFCATREVSCISKAKPECNQQCLVSMVQCTAGAFGDLEKTVGCFQGYAKCAEEKC